MTELSSSSPGSGAFRVLLDLRPVRIPISGVARYCIELVTALRSDRNAPEITGLFYGNRDSNEGLRKTQQLQGIASASSAKPKLLMSALEFAPTIGKFLVRGKFDLVHESYFANVSERGDAPKVATIHDVIPVERPEYANRRNRFFSRKNLHRQASQASRIICVSEYSRRKVTELTDVDPAKIVVIPCGVTPVPARVDADFVDREGLSDKRYFLFVGNIEPRKNLVVLAEAVARLTGSEADILLVVAGHLNYQAHEIIDACKARLGSRFIYLGAVTEEHKVALFAAAMAFVFPSLYEGFGIPVVEAFQARCPVLIADNTSLSELAVDTKQLFDAESVDILVSRMRDVASGASWVAQSVATAAAGLDRFSWRSVASRTLDVYRQVVGR